MKEHGTGAHKARSTKPTHAHAVVMHRLMDAIAQKIQSTKEEREARRQFTIERAGEVPESDLWNTFNLGVGFCLVLPEAAVEQALSICATQGHRAWVLGTVESGSLGEASLAGLPY